MRRAPEVPATQSPRCLVALARSALAGYASAAESKRRWAGKGEVASPLRPAGIAELEGERVDVVCQGEYIEAAAPVEVVRVEGNRIVVRRARDRREQE